MADVTKLAGLSLGIVNLHFETKEKLLVETLRFITDEYRNGLDKIFFIKADGLTYYKVKTTAAHGSQPYCA